MRVGRKAADLDTCFAFPKAKFLDVDCYESKVSFYGSAIANLLDSRVAEDDIVKVIDR